MSGLSVKLNSGLVNLKMLRFPKKVTQEAVGVVFDSSGFNRILGTKSENELEKMKARVNVENFVQGVNLKINEFIEKRMKSEKFGSTFQDKSVEDVLKKCKSKNIEIKVVGEEQIEELPGIRVRAKFAGVEKDYVAAMDDVDSLNSSSIEKITEFSINKVLSRLVDSFLQNLNPQPAVKLLPSSAPSKLSSLKKSLYQYFPFLCNII